MVKPKENALKNNKILYNIFYGINANKLKFEYKKISNDSWKTLAILSCITTMVMYTETMLMPAIPNLRTEFDISYGTSSWILASYLISGAVMTPLAGKLSDIYGQKRILLIIMAIYIMGVTAAAFSNDIITLLIARAIQGIGGSTFPIVFVIIRDKLSRETISIGQGIIASMFAAGSVIGLTIGGIIVQYFGWRMTFFTILPISIILLICIKNLIHIDKESKIEKQDNLDNSGINNKFDKFNKSIHSIFLKHAQSIKKFCNVKVLHKNIIQLDIKGTIALSLATVSFLLALTMWDLPTDNQTIHNGHVDTSVTRYSIESIVTLLIVGICALIIFVMIEKRSKFPLIDFVIFFKESILLSSLIVMIVGMSMFMVVFYAIPTLLQAPEPIGFGMDIISTGILQLPFALMILFFGATSGFIVPRVGSVNSIILGSILMTIGFSLLLLFHLDELSISVSLAVIAAGLCLASISANNVIILSAPQEYSGVIIGMSNLLRFLGCSIGPTLAAMYLQTNQTLMYINGINVNIPSSTSFNMIFSTAIILSIASIIISIILRQKIKNNDTYNINYSKKIS